MGTTYGPGQDPEAYDVPLCFKDRNSNPKVTLLPPPILPFRADNRPPSSLTTHLPSFKSPTPDSCPDPPSGTHYHCSGHRDSPPVLPTTSQHTDLHSPDHPKLGHCPRKDALSDRRRVAVSQGDRHRPMSLPVSTGPVSSLVAPLTLT